MREGRCVSARCIAVGLLLTAVVFPASATMKYGPLEISGNLESQNLVRHSTADELQFVQNRNTFRLRLDWDWVDKGKLADKYSVPFLERSKFFLLYRGVYDGFYDIAPSNLQHGQTRFDDRVGGRITDLSDQQRNNAKWENRLREVYVDGKLKDLPVSFRIGRQQVIWGESDQFRIMDIWNPLDVTWHFQQESWDNIRVPLWLAKGLWDIGEVWKLSNVFMEVVYNPFDFQPGIKADFNPKPWALPFPDPLRSGQVQLDTQTSLLISPQFHLTGNYHKGDFQRNPQDASEVGTRFHFVTPQGLELSANYLYGRGRGVGAASPFGVKINRVQFPFASTDITSRFAIGRFSDGTGRRAENIVPIDVDAEVVHPYMHIFGLTGNYFEDFTEFVIRFESAYVLGEPYQTVEKSKLVPITYSDGVLAPGDATSPLGFTKQDIWTGMVGFDRPTWIRWLNPRATWFISGQFFWNYVTGNVHDLRGNAGVGDDPYFTPTGGIASQTQGFGTWDCSRSTDPNCPQGKVERLQNARQVGNGDNIRRWEHLITIAMTSFYRGGTLVPFLASAWDPVNSNLELLWNLDYYLTNDLILQLQQKYFMTYGSGLPSNDPWYAGGRFARRDETGVKLTFQF